MAWLLSVTYFLIFFFKLIYTLGEARRTRHRLSLGDEGKQAKKLWGVSGPPPYPPDASYYAGIASLGMQWYRDLGSVLLRKMPVH